MKTGVPVAGSATEASVEELLATGLFERHWYAAQSGGYFRTNVAAAAHFIAEGMPKDRSPHPLMDTRVWPQHLRDAWRARDLTGVMRAFRAPKSQQPAVGPLFEARFINVPDDAYANHPGGVLGHFLQRADDATILATRYGELRFADVRGSWPSLYERLKAHTRLSKPRQTERWDDERGRSWLRALPPLVRSDASPRFSVIMPAWNRSAEVARAIRSVQAQSYSTWELLVMDDGSVDSTADVVRAIAETDERVRLVRLAHGGVSAARNAGLARARGQLAAFLDSDNAWPGDYLELMARGFAASQVKAAYAALELHDRGKVTFRAFEGGLEHLLVMNHVDLNVLVVERKLAQAVGFDDGVRRWVDHDFAIRVAKATELAYFPFIGAIYDDDRGAPNRITTSESESWQWAVLGKNVADVTVTPEGGIVRGRVSVVMPVYQDWSMTLRAVTKVLENSGDVDVEVVLVDNGSAAHVGAVLSQFFAAEPRVRYERLARNMNFAIGSNFGASIASGEFLCFLNNDTEVRPGWLQPLVERLGDTEVLGVQPLLLYPDDSIQTAGTVFLAPRALPAHFLVGLPPEDARTVVKETFNAVSAACLLMRRADFSELRGFDAIFVNGMEDIDLCLRGIARFGGHFAVEPRSRVTHHESKTPGRGRQIPENRKFFMERWRERLPGLELDKFVRAGFKVVEVGGDALWLPQPRPLVVRDRAASEVRWGIRHAAIGGQRGDRWGDTYYVESLAAALRAQGQQVVTYRHGANGQGQRSHDDVNLVLRGLDPVHPIPGQVNILWVISHPEDVTAEEVRSFDVVFASSASWARAMSVDAGVEVGTLLQATDVRVFRPAAPGEEIERRPLTFVGASFPHRTRRVVADALSSGVDLRVIGHGWRDLPGAIHEAEEIANTRLGAVYRGASRVLADHWPDMAAMGFIQNRIFDAIACGAPVISDRVQGLDGVFGSMVQMYEDADHLRYLAGADADAVFGSPDERAAQTSQVLRDHSFDARARTLIASAGSARRRVFES